jgi:hypothetical protein
MSFAHVNNGDMFYFLFGCFLLRHATFPIAKNSCFSREFVNSAWTFLISSLSIFDKKIVLYKILFYKNLKGIQQNCKMENNGELCANNHDASVLPDLLVAIDTYTQKVLETPR